MSQEELEKIKNRLYELQNLSILASSKNDFNSLIRYGKEMQKIKKILKKAEKNARKIENR